MSAIPPRDPNGYYAALGVSNQARPAEIKAAYRKHAKRVHPDSNPSDSAAGQFQRLAEAYATLRDPDRRAAYDRTTEVPLLAPPPRNDDIIEPAACSRCQKASAQPRYVIFHMVISFGIWARRTVREGVFCRDCADRVAVRASTLTWIFGWWSLPGPWYSIKALIRNVKGGDKPGDVNGRLLLHQARAFGAQGKKDVARGILEQAIRYAQDPVLAKQIRSAASALEVKGPRLKNRWRPFGYAALAQAMPLFALLLLAGLGGAMLLWRFEPDSAVASIAIRPADIGEVRHVAVDLVKLREAPEESAPVVALLDRFTAVRISEVLDRGAWVRVRTANGGTGFVSGRVLYAGTGSAARTKYCAENRGERPAHGEVLVRRGNGAHRLSVRNPFNRDANVKLKTAAGYTLLSVYVGAADTLMVDQIPEGSFRITYALGEDFSRACGLFLGDMTAQYLPFPLIFRAGRTDETSKTMLMLTLQPPGEARGQAKVMDAQLFALDE